MSIAIRVRRKRKELGMTQAQLAERAGLNTLSIVRLENGHVKPRASTLAAIKPVLGIKRIHKPHRKGAGRPRKPLLAVPAKPTRPSPDRVLSALLRLSGEVRQLRAELRKLRAPMVYSNGTATAKPLPVAEVV